MSLARAVAVAIVFTALFGLIVYSQTTINDRFAEIAGGTSRTTTTDQVDRYVETLRDLSLKLPIAVGLASAPAMVARLLMSRRRLLEIIKVEDFKKHILLFGPTGSGKTSTALRIIELSLKKNLQVEILDWKGEYFDKIRGATVVRKLRLLQPPDWSNVEVHILTVVDILRDVLQLTDPMTYMLYEELSKMYEVGEASFRTLLQRLKTRRAVALANRALAEANIAEGLIRRILPLVLDEEREIANLRGHDRVKIYDLSELPTYQLKTLYSEIILWRIFNEAVKDKSHVLKKIVIAEESQNYVRPRRVEMQPSIGERIVNELRAYGCGFILISPDPSQLPYHMTRDCGAVVSIGYQALPEMILEFLNNYRYADIKRLIKTTSKLRTYIYYNGRLYIKKTPRPYRGIIDLGVENIPETIEEEKLLKTEEETKIQRVEEVKAEEATLKIEEEGEEGVREVEEVKTGEVEKEAPEELKGLDNPSWGFQHDLIIISIYVSRPSRPQELKIEEEVEEAGEAEVAQEDRLEEKKTYPMGEHEVIEVFREDDVFAYLKCVRCGLEARIVEVDKLTSTRCKASASTVLKDARREDEECVFCCKKAIGRYYTGGATPTEMILVPMCSDCLSKHEQFYMKNRPTIVYGKKLVKGIYPAMGDEKIAWVNEIGTWFVMDEKGSWPCPRCSMRFDRLGEAVKHFVEKHPELTSTKDKIDVIGVGELFKTWQGLYCNVCGMIMPDENALREHHRIHHGDV